MNLNLAGRVVVVSGAASGIGRACATEFAREGAQLALVDRDQRAGTELATDLASQFSVDCLCVGADVTSEAEVAEAMTEVANYFGGIDIAVACAGISGEFGVDVADADVAAFDQVMAVNVRGQFLLVKHATPHLAAAKEPAVVLMASDSSFVAAPGMLAYNASKGAVLQMTRALSVDLAPRRIRVNCVCPSVVDTPMARADLGVTDFDASPYPVQTPEQIAAHVLYLASPVSAPINGTSVVSDFGYLARSSFPA